MKREDFIGLPPALALGLIWDSFPGIAKALSDKLVPVAPRSPKFDGMIFRNGGHQWCSETALEGLRYWYLRYTESAERGGEWAEKDRKRAKQLTYWIEWRLIEPHTQWSGERNHERVTAAPPSDKPTVYPREERKRDSQPPSTAPRFEDNPVDDEDVPY